MGQKSNKLLDDISGSGWIRVDERVGSSRGRADVDGADGSHQTITTSTQQPVSK